MKAKWDFPIPEFVSFAIDQSRNSNRLRIIEINQKVVLRRWRGGTRSCRGGRWVQGNWSGFYDRKTFSEVDSPCDSHRQIRVHAWYPQRYFTCGWIYWLNRDNCRRLRWKQILRVPEMPDQRAKPLRSAAAPNCFVVVRGSVKITQVGAGDSWERVMIPHF